MSKLRSEALVGLLLGAASALVVATVAFVWLGQGVVVLCLLGAIAGGMGTAALIGVAMPNLLHRLELDPQVAAGPIALAASDMLTLLIYFNLARWLLV